MGAHLNITTYTGYAVSLSEIIEILHSRKVSYNIKQIEIFDNWEFKNFKIYFDNLSEELILEQIMLGKICICRMELNSSFLGGITFSQADKDVYETSAWLDTTNLQYLNTDFITNHNRTFYIELTTNIIKIVNPKKFLIAGIGVETLIEYQPNLQQMIKNAYGIARWIVPTKLTLSQDWIKTDLNNFILDRNN